MAPLKELDPDIKVLSKKRYNTIWGNLEIHSAGNFLKQVAECSDLLFKMIQKPSLEAGDEFTEKFFHMLFGIRDQYRKERSIQAMFYVMCSTICSKHENASILDFERRFCHKKNKIRKYMEIDGGLIVGKTAIIFECKKHGKNGPPDPLETILGKDYNGKLTIGDEFKSVLLIGAIFKGNSYLIVNNNYVITEVVKCELVKGKIQLYNNRTILASRYPKDEINYPT